MRPKLVLTTCCCALGIVGLVDDEGPVTRTVAWTTSSDHGIPINGAFV